MDCRARRRLLLLSSHLNPLPQTSLRTCLSTSSCRSDKETNRENDCVFRKIIRGEAPAFKVYEDDACLCILDTHPLSLDYRGHVSKMPIISNAVMKATGCDSFNLVRTMVKPQAK